MLLLEGERLLGAVELDPEPVLATGRDLADDQSSRARRRRSRTGRATASSVHDARGAAVRPCAAGERVATAGVDCARGTAVSSRAALAVMRWPETNSARSHQCEPMSAKARDGPPRALVHAPVVVLAGAAASPGGRCRAGGAPRRLGPAAIAPARLAHRRVVPVDERHARPEPGVGGEVDQALRAGGVERPAASRRSHACPAASAASASGTGAGGSACRCASTSTSGSSTSSSPRRRRAPRRAARRRHASARATRPRRPRALPPAARTAGRARRR